MKRIPGRVIGICCENPDNVFVGFNHEGLIFRNSPAKFDHSLRHVDNELTAPEADSCAYCGHAMDPRLYFCPGCSKPHRPVEHLLPARMPDHADNETKLRTRAPEAWNTLFLYLIVCIITYMVGLAIWGMDHLEPVIMAADVALAAFTAVLAFRHWDLLRGSLSCVAGLIHPMCWAGLLLMAPVLALNHGYHTLLADWFAVEPGDFNGYFTSRWGAVLCMCVFPAVSEEIAFRGIIQQQFERVVSAPVAIGVASIVFSAAHFSLLSAPYLVLVGGLLGWMKWKTGSLYPPMLAHFLHNYIVITWF